MRPSLTAGLFGALVLVLAWAPHHQPERDTTVYIHLLRRAQCEYRGITATFEEVTRAYALKAYEQAELLRWEAGPSPDNPAIETLVWAVFSAAGVAPDPVPLAVREVRRQGLSTFGVGWRYNQLVSTQITPYNAYARDALAVFRRTVDDFIAQMVVVKTPAALRTGPGPDHAIVDSVQAGTVLLLENSQEGWGQVRIPSTPTVGWLATDTFYQLAHVQ